MSVIIPSVTSYSRDQYNTQIQLATNLTRRVHIDIADGIFTPQGTVGVESLWWPAGAKADVHVMYQNPEEIMGELIVLKPHMVTVHAEANGDFISLAKRLHAKGIKAGLALLPETPVSYVRPGVGFIDHILIFSGSLGEFGGKADLDLLQKVQEIRAMDKSIEIGWDGGANDTTVSVIAGAGVDTIVSGGYIQNATNPAHAYKQLQRLSSAKH
jgi:ribulose-phosphate 3-epimerase